MAVPPEVVFSRFFQEHFPYNPPVRPEDPDSRLYRGRDDLSGLPPVLQETLRGIQEDFNKVLRSEKRGVPEHVDPPPFHFDYVDSSVQNAIAFRYGGYSFIGITIPLLNEMEATSKKLCGSEAVLSILSPHCISVYTDLATITTERGSLLETYVYYRKLDGSMMSVHLSNGGVDLK
jgi:hypothetical protein